ncbi:MAG: NAD(P)/FAD-dependent oxidoreductase [bacterium]|nr:NAD(P)/FAD-dependent oxidoreductase [bacterium]
MLEVYWSLWCWSVGVLEYAASLTPQYSKGVMDSHWDVIIVGGGIAGVTAAKTLREGSPETTILLISAEDRIPYKRTKVSKCIAEGFERNQFQLQPETWYREQRIDLNVQSKVSELDPSGHRIRLKSGEEFSWDKLILATGAKAVLPEEFRVKGGRVHVIRGAEDVEQLLCMADRDVKRALVVGTGVLGVEMAEQLRLLNKEVSMVGNAPTLMSRHLNAHAAEVLKRCCEREGISLILQERVSAVTKNADNSLDVALIRQELHSDLLLFCIGARPDVELARQAGLDLGQGIRVNHYLRSSHPDVFAAGDVAEHPGDYISGLWHAAELQGQVAAKNVLGHIVPYDQRPFRLKCEVFGQYFFSMNKPADSELSHYRFVERQHGECSQAFYYQEGRLRSVVMINDKPRAKLYEQAVREGWEEARTHEAFGMDDS